MDYFYDLLVQNEKFSEKSKHLFLGTHTQYDTCSPIRYVIKFFHLYVLLFYIANFQVFQNAIYRRRLL